ncbi:MAG: protein translocase subunit SecDF [Bacteroidetes bacterium]|nr:protein translocase subunit SecDF [Bacteroidota bacterium]
MQNKGIVRFFALALVLVCIYQLSFTFYARKVESNAKEFAYSDKFRTQAENIAKAELRLEGEEINPERLALRTSMIYDSISKFQENFYLDSMMNQSVYNFLWIKKYTFRECKERELNLGLDLRGGMNVTLEISVEEIVHALSNYSTDQTYTRAMALAKERQRTSTEDFIILFANAFKEVDPNASLASIFSTAEMRDRIPFNASNEDVITVLSREVDDAVDRSFNILRTRIDRFGVAQPNIQKLATSGRILVELPGIKEPDRVRRLLQGTARLEFWETFEFSEVYELFMEANERLRGTIGEDVDAKEKELLAQDSRFVFEGTESNEAEAKADSVEKTDIPELLDLIETAPETDEFKDFAKDNPLFAYLEPAFVMDPNMGMVPGRGPVVGMAKAQDVSRVNAMLAQPQVKSLFPRTLKLYWTAKPNTVKGQDYFQLIAIKSTGRDGRAPLTGDVISDARQDFSPTGNAEIAMNMNSEGARIWRRLTADNVQRSIAIVLDDLVYSFPTVQNEIAGGRSSITGTFSIQEAQDLANILKAGSLPAPARIVEEAIVGPSLGREAINSGMISFIVAFILVLIYMASYYSKAGLVADFALVANIFFIFGVLASLGAVLTLPGIAGIVLTLGMAVDANVIIYERIIEEIRAGKGLKLAISDGYKNAYSAIIDGNVTTLLTGVVLYIFGSGPVQGFATTLIIGIICSLFTAILLSRYIFSYWIDRNKNVSFETKISRGFLANVNFDFIGVRKKFYVLSAIVIMLGITSFFVRGLSYGIDFAGGRTYVVRFDNDKLNTQEIRNELTARFVESPEVVTFGPNRQLRITTSFLINDDSAEADSIAERTLYEGLKDFFENPVTFEQFSGDEENKLVGRLSSQKVGPTVARDIKIGAIISVIVALFIIFFYIAIRFKKWQFGLGGLITLAHDAIIVISLYSWFHHIVPWTMEIDQIFIAAILTVIGYSINDTVVIFDRVRENLNLFPKRDLKTNVNLALNATLSRTFNTSGTTAIVLLIIFFFGGEVIRGFSFALLIGVIVGTYSSLFNSTTIAYDLINWSEKKNKKK